VHWHLINFDLCADPHTHTHTHTHTQIYPSYRTSPLSRAFGCVVAKSLIWSPHNEVGRCLNK